MEKKASEKFSVLPSASALRASKVMGEDVSAAVRALFDEDTFVETGAFTKRNFCECNAESELEGVITGYGAISGELVFAFIQDPKNKSGAIDARHAEKICSLYKLAVENGAPVIGVFASAGADVFEGVDALAAYAKIAKAVSGASGVVPQIAIINGLCTGTLAAVAAMFDFVVSVKGSSLYVAAPALVGSDTTQSSVISYAASDISDASAYARKLLSLVPSNASLGVTAEECNDDPSRSLGNITFEGDARSALGAIADGGEYTEVSALYAPSMLTALCTVGGIRCGVVATSSSFDGGRITPSMAKKAAKFVSFCDSFALPVVTLVDSDGLAQIADGAGEIFASDLARLASAYASSLSPKVTVVTGHAIGAAFAILGSKAIGADIAYALDTAEISALPADAAVAFVWNDKVTGSDSRNELENEWRASLASPSAAASTGAIDDIISVGDLRARICSALYMLTQKGTSHRRHAVMPL